jgi:DNA polymerase-2
LRRSGKSAPGADPAASDLTGSDKASSGQVGTHSGFIVQPTYRVVRGRPVVLLYGRLQSGETFLVRDNRMTPYFYVEAQDASRVEELGGRLQESDFETMQGQPVVRVDLAIPADAPALRDKLHEAGLPTFEADVRFVVKYLIERGVRGSVEIEGEAKVGKRVDWLFDNPTLRPAPERTEVPLEVLSIDIETDPRIMHVLSIALFGCGHQEVLLLTPESRGCPKSATPARDERQLLQLFGERVRKLDPDVIIGWNVADFDFDVLVRRADQLKVPLELGRSRGATRLRRGDGWRQSTQVVIPGRIVLDGPQTLRSSFVTYERMGLDFVARKVLGEGKIESEDPAEVNKAETILRWFRDAREKFVDYNLRDARLALQIFEQLRLIELSVERSRLTGMALDRVSASVASFDFLYLSELHKRRLVAPSVSSPTRSTKMSPMAGGHLLEPVVGLHENVLLLDFKSLYPSLIRTFQIDPLGHIRAAEDESPTIAPNRAAFRKQPGILPSMLDELFPRREAAKRQGDVVTSQAIKILMNSFYGVMGTSSCRFFDPRLANAITGFGKELLLWSKRRIEAKGYAVLYGDTDSVFVSSGVSSDEAPALGERLASELTVELGEFIHQKWGVESKLELEFERLYLKLFLPSTRGGGEGAMKRYAGLIPGKVAAGTPGVAKPEVVFTGLEAVRRDWTDFARQAQRELYRRLFLELPVEEYLVRLASDLRSGRLDDFLIYRKAMRKQESEYTTTTPPHVAAARKMSRPTGRLIEYVMTVAGPEPAEEREHDLDYEHYLVKQLQPIAEPVLALLELEFRRVIGDDKQLDLFA